MRSGNKPVLLYTMYTDSYFVPSGTVNFIKLSNWGHSRDIWAFFRNYFLFVILPMEVIYFNCVIFLAQ